jgi:hypothetical protein
MNILFVSSLSVIAKDPSASRPLFVRDLGLPLEPVGGTEYFASEKIAGCKHFGVWPLAEAAEACFGSKSWPSDRPLPQASIEFEVVSEAAVEASAAELRKAGHALLHDARKEPWGQTVARLQSADGLIIGISFAPWMH